MRGHLDGCSERIYYPEAKHCVRPHPESGRLVLDSKGGIDRWQYQPVILKPKMISFANAGQKDRPIMIFQEDKVPSHASKHQAAIFSAVDVERLIWPGNLQISMPLSPVGLILKGVMRQKRVPAPRKTAASALIYTGG